MNKYYVILKNWSRDVGAVFDTFLAVILVIHKSFHMLGQFTIKTMNAVTLLIIWSRKNDEKSCESHMPENWLT